MAHTRREKNKLPKDVSKLTSDEVMEKVFSKRVAKKLKEVAHEHDTDSDSNGESSHT